MIKILVVDDERLVRDSIATLLGLSDEIEVVATAASGEEALEFVTSKQGPDVVVADLQMPGIDGIELAATLQQEHAIPTVIVTSHALPGMLETAIAAGVAGVVSKAASSQTLMEAVTRVAQGDNFVDPDVAFKTMLAGPNPLSAVEREILTQARFGASVEVIAKQINVSATTVRTHLNEAVKKLKAANRLEAAAVARANGWI